MGGYPVYGKHFPQAFVVKLSYRYTLKQKLGPITYMYMQVATNDLGDYEVGEDNDSLLTDFLLLVLLLGRLSILLCRHTAPDLPGAIQQGSSYNHTMLNSEITKHNNFIEIKLFELQFFMSIRGWSSGYLEQVNPLANYLLVFTYISSSHSNSHYTVPNPLESLARKIHT